MRSPKLFNLESGNSIFNNKPELAQGTWPLLWKVTNGICDSEHDDDASSPCYTTGLKQGSGLRIAYKQISYRRGSAHFAVKTGLGTTKVETSTANLSSSA